MRHTFIGACEINHPVLSLQDKYPSKNHSYSDRYNDRHESPGGRRGSSREHSPHNRYQNKQSYMDRNRERLQKGTHVLVLLFVVAVE